MTKSIFETCSLGHLTLRNRFVRSATAESRATHKGVLKDEIFPIYEALACGGVGLIITGHMYVSEDGRCSRRQTGISRPDHIPALRRLAQVSHAAGARVVAQINYAGRPPHKMSKADIVDVADRFVAAGGRTLEAGFDGVQIHAAHGFLLSGFLTPSVNRRTDSYGGDAQGRRRLLIEIASRLRQSLGRQYPILCKLGSIDGRDNSLRLEESVATAQALAEAGIDAIEVSCTRSGEHAQPAAQGIDKPEREAYFAAQAGAIKQTVDLPIILVGGLRSRSVMQDVVDRGICDLVSACRPFIREPDLVHRMATGDVDRSSCISCNQCYCRNGLRCVHVSAGRRHGWWAALKSRLS